MKMGIRLFWSLFPYSQSRIIWQACQQHVAFHCLFLIRINVLDYDAQLLVSVRKMAQPVHSLWSLALETPSVTGC